MEASSQGDFNAGTHNLLINLTSKPMADYHWWCVEYQVKFNDVGSQNGILELWIDGT